MKLRDGVLGSRQCSVQSGKRAGCTVLRMHVEAAQCTLHVGLLESIWLASQVQAVLHEWLFEIISVVHPLTVIASQPVAEREIQACCA